MFGFPMSRRVLGLSIALCGAVSLAGCGGDDSGHSKKPTGDVGTAPSGECKPGKQAECDDSDCTSGKPAVATCGSNKKYGACKCPAKSGSAEDGGSGDAGGDAAMSGGEDGGGKITTGGAWPMMGYDVKNNYFNPNEKTLSPDNADKIVELWRFEVAGYPPGTPVVAEGKVFALATGGMYAINLADGSKAWERTDLAGQSSAAYADGFVYIHTTPGAQLYKLNAADGKTVWGPVKTYEHPSSDGTSSPIVSGTTVMVGHSTTAEVVGDGQEEARGGVEAFDTKTGERLWTYYTVPETGENGAMIWSTVSVDADDGTVFAAAGNNYTVGGKDSDAIHAIDIATGKKKWVTQVREDDVWVLFGSGGGLDTDFGANPILAEVDGKKVVADGDKGAAFWVLDRKTGQTLWSRTDLSTSHTMANGGVLNNGAFDGKYFYVLSNQPPAAAVLHALDPAQDGKDAWEPKMFDKIGWGALSAANGLLVVPIDSELQIYDAATGDKLNSFETGGTIAAGAAAIVDGKIVVKSGLSYPLDSTTKNNNLVICYGLK